MRYNRLGQSGLVVSELCLGAMTFGNKPSGFFQHDLDQDGSTALVKQALDPRIKPASANDWDCEYLEAILSVAVVDGLDAALAHIDRHSSNHTDAIVTEDTAAAERFLAEVDSAIVMVNASTQFADGGEFGLGAEIGVATGRLHARGPVALEGLTTYKWQVRGHGEARP